MSDIFVKIQIQNDYNNEATTDYTACLPQPFSAQNKLDESLDLSYIVLKNSTKATPFMPFLKANLPITQGDTTKSEIWYIADDQVTEILGNELYEHNITLIEETKILERLVCDTKTITQPLSNEITQYDVSPFSDWSGYATLQHFDTSATKYKSPIVWTEDTSPFWDSATKTLTFWNSFHWFTTISSGNTKVYYYDEETGTETELYSSGVEYSATTHSLVLTHTNGFYRIFHTANQGGGTVCAISFDIRVTEEIPAKADVTLYDAINQILLAYKCIRTDETNLPRVTLANVTTGSDYVLTSQLQAIKSPELSFGKMTLWEIFSAIGGKIHAIPKLINNQLYFEKIIKNTQAMSSVKENIYLVSNIQSQSNEQFCDKLDSDVDNLIDTDDIDEASITEPNETWLKTLRTETGVVVVKEADTFIQTQYPIERLVKVECGYLTNGTYVGDITDFLFESAEYNALSSYTSAPPSKSNSIYYTYGEKGIKGLTFKPTTAVTEWASVFQLFNYYAIINIIATKTNQQPSAIAQLFTSTYDLRNLQFKVTYVPRISARVKQAKPLIADNRFNSSITYTQGANLVSALYYGDNLKGVVSRYGMPETHKVFYLTSVNQIPKIGQRYKDTDLRVAQVNTHYFKDFIKCEVQLAKNFNRYSQYVGANNSLRLYEISEKQAVDRKVVYEEYIALSCEANNTNDVLHTTNNANSVIMQNQALLRFMQSFATYTSESPYTGHQIDVVNFQGFNESGTAITTWRSLPVISLGVGNSMYFDFKMADNYSVGDKIVARESGGTYYDAQQYVKYADYYGDIYSLNMRIGSSDTSNAPTTFAGAWTNGNNVPAMFVNTTYDLTATDNKRIIIVKDNKEILNVAYQVHFVSVDNSIIIGSGLARENLLVKNKSRNYKLYVLTSPIEQFTETIDTSGLTENNTFGVNDCFTAIDSSTQRRYGGLENPTASTNGVAWAIVDDESGAFICGRNVTITSGQTITMPKFYPIRKFDN